MAQRVRSKTRLRLFSCHRKLFLLPGCHSIDLLFLARVALFRVTPLVIDDQKGSSIVSLPFKFFFGFLHASSLLTTVDSFSVRRSSAPTHTVNGRLRRAFSLASLSWQCPLPFVEVRSHATIFLVTRDRAGSPLFPALLHFFFPADSSSPPGQWIPFLRFPHHIRPPLYLDLRGLFLPTWDPSARLQQTRARVRASPLKHPFSFLLRCRTSFFRPSALP